MTEDFQEMFEEETREQIEKMNEHLLSLEEDPTDLEPIEEIYRASHTLKGMAGTMGYEGIQKISHRMEELFDELKSEKGEVQDDLFDLLFECVDAIEVLSGDEEADADVERLIDDLDRALADDLEQDSDDEEAEEDSKIHSDLPSDVKSIFEENRDEELTLGLIKVSEDEKLPTVRGVQIREKIDFEYRLFWPDPEEAESSRRKFYIVTDKELEKKDLEKASNVDIEIKRGKGEAFLEEPEKEEIKKNENKKERKIETSDKLKVDLKNIEHVMNLISELVISKGSLEDLSRSLDSDRLSNITGRIDRITSELRESVLDLKMTEIKSVFRRFPRMVRDLAKENDKEIDFQMEGEEIELDRTILDRITNPMVHLLRNAVDHGIEPAEERKAKGKPPEGKLKVAARQQEENVVIEVSDDGRGLDVGKIKNKAIKSGLIDEEEAEGMSDEEIYMLIFNPYFSTKEEVTKVSGRGVGMEVVKKTMDSLGGEVNIDSEKDEGTTVSLTLPPSVAIIQAFLIEVGGGSYAIPLEDIVETAQIPPDEVEMIEGKDFIRLRDEYLPLIYLKKEFEDVPIESIKGENEKLKVVIVSNEGKTAGFVIDEVMTEKEIVIKPLPENLQNLGGFMGATILGDGTIAMILDTLHWIRSTS
ncbi:MAG: chemotaxis protein CheA [Thermoplasmata archaeon]